MSTVSQAFINEEEGMGKMTAHKTSEMRSGRVSRNFEARGKGKTTAYERSYEKQKLLYYIPSFCSINTKKYYFEIWFL